MATLGTNIVLFGGESASEMFADTWTWDGQVWLLQHPSHSPPGRSMSTLAQLPSGGGLLLFGGFGPTGNPGPLNDTWLWDGTAWHVQTPASPPAVRFGHAMASSTSATVMFGGDGQPATLGDTWQWASMQWNSSVPVPAPSARYWHAMAGLEGSVVLFGGMQNLTASQETWVFASSGWTHRVDGAMPPARVHHAMATLGTRVVMFGGLDTAELQDTWEWDGAAWTAPATAPPPGRQSHAMATLGNQVLMFGGLSAGSPLDDTWVYQ